MTFNITLSFQQMMGLYLVAAPLAMHFIAIPIEGNFWERRLALTAYLADKAVFVGLLMWWAVFHLHAIQFLYLAALVLAFFAMLVRALRVKDRTHFLTRNWLMRGIYQSVLYAAMLLLFGFWTW